MRIAQIIESTSGGSVRAALALAQELLNGGEDITFIYSPLRADTVFDSGLKALSTPNKIAFPMRRDVGLHDLGSAFRLYQLIKKTGPYDILHAHSSKAGALARIVGIFFPAMKIFYTPHAFITMGTKNSRFFGFIERVLSHFTASIIAVSAQEKEHAIYDLRINENKITVIPNGLSFSSLATRGEARSRMGFGEQETILGYVGRLSEQKNPIRLINAFAPLAREYPHLILVILGDGALLEKTKKQIALHEIEKRVRILPDQEARLYIPGFDTLICASDYEGLPLVFIEALKSAVPIITTPVGGAQECVIQKITGFIAQDFETNSLSEALRLYLDLKTPARKEMSLAAQKHGENFTATRMTQEVLKLYRSACETK